MLVLTRHRGGQVIIAGDVVLTVVAIEGNKVRLGVEAPSSIRVDRKEVHDRRVYERNDGPSIMSEIDADCPVG